MWNLVHLRTAKYGARPVRITLALGLLGMLFVGSPQLSLAQSAEELKDMSLEELLDLEVTAATKTRGFSASSAPSVIRVFTRRDLDQFGLETLRDVLAIVPGNQFERARSRRTPGLFGAPETGEGDTVGLTSAVESS
jgi:hypothetical protein